MTEATPPPAGEEALRDALVEARLQIEYLHEKFQVTGTGNAALARIDAALSTSPSSDRRRGLEEAAKLAEGNYPVHARVDGYSPGIKAAIAARIRALIPPSSEGGEEK